MISRQVVESTLFLEDFPTGSKSAPLGGFLADLGDLGWAFEASSGRWLFLRASSGDTLGGAVRPAECFSMRNVRNCVIPTTLRAFHDLDRSGLEDRKSVSRSQV